jgi:ParB family chromosome partitioning protein
LLDATAKTCHDAFVTITPYKERDPSMELPRKRGLSALLAATTLPENALPTPATAAGQPAASSSAPASPGPVLTNSLTTGDIPILHIRPNPKQPRTDFEPQALAELAASIKARGLIQPVVLRQLQPHEVSGEQRYELIAGERRWRASQVAGLTVLPAVIKPLFDEREILLVSLVENLQRDDLNPLEEALAYERLAKTFSLTHDQIADGVGKSRATISNMIRVLDLPSTIQDALKNKKLTMGHAKVLLTIPDARIQCQLAAKVQAQNLTVRDLERLIVGASEEAPASVPQTAPREKGTRNTRVAPPHVQDIERRMREHFGTRVTVEENLRKGRIVIEFYSVEDFERIAKLMGIES